MEFAVSVEGVSKVGQASWVLAVDRSGVLIAHEDGTLHWHELSECHFMKCIPPDAPLPVIPVQSPDRIVVPQGRIERKINGR